MEFSVVFLNTLGRVEQNSRVYELVPNVMIFIFLALFGTSLGFLIAGPSTFGFLSFSFFQSF